MLKISLSLAAFLASTSLFAAEHYNPGAQSYDGGETSNAPMKMTPPSKSSAPQELKSSSLSANDRIDLLKIIDDIEMLRGNEIAEARLNMYVDFGVVASKIDEISSGLTKLTRKVDQSQQPKLQKAITDLNTIRGHQIAEARQGLEADFAAVNTSMHMIMESLKTVR